MAPTAVPLHRRTIDFEAFEDDGVLSITGRLRDERPWAEGTALVAQLHDMQLHVEVRAADLTITAARAEMDRYPHTECTDITPKFENLVGLNVGRGYTRAVQERFAGALGCTHLDQLARTLGPVVIQAVTSMRARSRNWASLDTPPAERPSMFPRNTCHIWAEGGVAERKLEAGWRPGIGGYPAPPVAVFLRPGGLQGSLPDEDGS